MPATSAKNLPLTPSAAEQGFGMNELSQQLSAAEEEERRRKMLGLGARTQSGSVLARTTPVLSPATLSLFGIGGYGR
jgi:hypothetical protein